MAQPSLSRAELRECLEEAVTCAKLCGNIMRECVTKMQTRSDERADLNKVGEEKNGCATDFVTEFDQACEKLVFDRLSKRFPSYTLLGEESYKGQKIGDEPTWVVDPIDGTLSFMHGGHDCCICIGLTVGKKPVLGVIYAPFLDEMYTAMEGEGAFCNGAPMRTSTATTLNRALVCSHFPSCTRGDAFIENLFGVWKKLMAHPVQGMRAYGSCGLDMCSVARGRLDIYFEVGIWAWDVCAGSVILREAGGVLLDIHGGKFDLEGRRLLACATPELAEAVLQYLKEYDFKL